MCQGTASTLTAERPSVFRDVGACVVGSCPSKEVNSGGKRASRGLQLRSDVTYKHAYHIYLQQLHIQHHT